ncbi:DUF6461 domain-containing protein [Streptomyces sp. NPDC004111]|uniref:DUF6461 domain-containing protein n=1 Tax=Streptomyces sp. NPDC004111 TaxID=3364690 RepID=UPI0036AD2495
MTDSTVPTTTAADFAWIREQYASLLEAYCVTLVEAITPEELLRALGAEPGERTTGVEDLCEPSYDVWDMEDGERLLVAAAPVGDWSLMVEYNGFLGITDEVALPLSRGRTVVSHFRNINAVDHFKWYRDGTTRLHFEPLFPHQRDGSHPDELLTAMRESGFDLSDAEDRPRRGHTEAAFALAQRITGVAPTPLLFAGAEFVGGLAQPPRSSR